MIDTVVLTIPKEKYGILQPDRFTPNASVLTGSGFNLVKCVLNPSANDKLNHNYRPRLTLMKRMSRYSTEIPLRIEFSLPKLLYGNNVEEIAETDFETIIRVLSAKLREVGVLVLSENLRNADVSAVHFSKNIELQDGYTSTFAIKELGKVNLPKRLDINRDSFRNDGRSLHYYTNSHSLVFYDKVYDLKKPQKRAMDKDQNYLQLSLFETTQKLEILRIEARITKRAKLNSVLKELGYPVKPTFRQVVNEKLSQKVLQTYWKDFASNSYFVFDMESQPKQILKSILAAHPDLKPNKAIFLVGLKLLAKDNGGIRELRGMVEAKAHYRTWLRVSEEIETLNEISSTPHGWVKQIETQIEDFQPYKLTVDV